MSPYSVFRLVSVKWSAELPTPHDSNPNTHTNTSPDPKPYIPTLTLTITTGESEYLFAPYSVFTLDSVEWSDELPTPHNFVLVPAIDNQKEDEDLPLAPWY